MDYIKLFEAYKEEDYQKMLIKLRDLVIKDSPKDDILYFISKYSNDISKNLDKVRIIVNRIYKYYSTFIQYIHLEENKYIRYFLPYQSHQGTDSDINKSFLPRKKDLYIKEFNLIKQNKNLNLEKIEYLLNRFFEILEWVNNTFEVRGEIYHNRFPVDYSRDVDIVRRDVYYKNRLKKTELENLNYFDMENEVEEIQNLRRKIEVELKKLMISND